jgi:hypothetical protein
MIFGFIGTFILAKAAGIDLITLSDPDKWDYSNPGLLTFLGECWSFNFLHYILFRISFCTIL